MLLAVLTVTVECNKQLRCAVLCCPDVVLCCAMYAALLASQYVPCAEVLPGVLPAVEQKAATAYACLVMPACTEH